MLYAQLEEIERQLETPKNETEFQKSDFWGQYQGYWESPYNYETIGYVLAVRATSSGLVTVLDWIMWHLAKNKSTGEMIATEWQIFLPKGAEKLPQPDLQWAMQAIFFSGGELRDIDRVPYDILVNKGGRYLEFPRLVKADELGNIRQRIRNQVYNVCEWRPGVVEIMGALLRPSTAGFCLVTAKGLLKE